MMFFDALFLFIVKQTTHKRDINIFLGKKSQNTQILGHF